MMVGRLSAVSRQLQKPITDMNVTPPSTDN
jgi:hypothetical protein